MNDIENADAQLRRALQSAANTIESELEEIRDTVADLRLLIAALTERVEELEALQ